MYTYAQKEEGEERQRTEGEEEGEVEGEERQGEEIWRGIRGIFERKDERIFFSSSRTTRGWARGAGVGYFERKNEKQREKKICAGNGSKIKLGERGRGGEGAEKGREKECAPG